MFILLLIILCIFFILYLKFKNYVPIGRYKKGKVYEIYNGVEQNQELFKIIEDQAMPMICINDILLFFSLNH
jgi:hypothetical protein